MHKTSILLKISIGILVLFVGWLFLAPFLASALIVEKRIEKADAILVLSGSSAYVERTQKAARLVKQGVSNRVLLTDDGEYAGWSRREQRNPPFVDLAKYELTAQGVEEDQIEVLSPQVTGTIYEARLLKKKMADEEWKSVLLVTSAYHSKRALWTFERELLSEDVEIGVIPAAVGEQTPSVNTWWFGRKGWQLVAGEYVKFIVYWLYY